VGPTIRRIYASLLGILIAVVTLAGLWIAPATGAAGRLWLLLAGIVVILAVAAYALLAPLARRLRVLEETATRMASGEVSARADVEYHDDLGGLARSLNEIAERTERERSALERGRDESAAALNYLPQGVALIAPDLTIRHANARFWESVEVEAPLRGAHLSAARQPALQEAVEDARRAGRAVTREVALYLSERLDVEATVAPVGNGATPEAWLLTIED